VPTYEYKCQACGLSFDQFQSINALPLTECPNCRKLQLQRLIGSGVGLLFKGHGFYITDHRSADYKKKAEADKPKVEKPKEKDVDSNKV